MKPRAASAQSEAKARSLDRLEAKVTELTRTLQIVEAARANLSDQYDYAPLGFVTLDAKGCVQEINLTAARMLGRERAGLLTMPFFSHVAKAQLKDFLHHLSECRRRQAEVITEVALQTRGGATLPVELRSVPVLDARGSGTVFRTAITSIAERLRTGAALQESEQRYRDLVELSPDGIFIQCNDAIVFANRAAFRLCGAVKAADLMGQELTEVVRPTDRQSVTALLEQAATTPEAPSREAQFLRRDGTSIEIELAARAFRHNGEPAVLVVARDISRRKEAERHVATISEHEKARFGRDLHDGLSQNLMGASWRAEALRNRLRGADPEAAAEADEIAKMVRKCLEEARSLARGLCPVTMERSGLVAALHELSAEVTGRARIECWLDCDDTLTIADMNVAMNVYRIAQEAVANAIKHGKARAILIQLATQNGKTTLQVRDDGKGFRMKPRQSGMGLHTMRYRASMIGGSLEVRRVGARGTLMTCSFPTKRDAP